MVPTALEPLTGGDQLAGAQENTIEHGLRKAASKGVLLARVIAGEEDGSGVEVELPAMAKNRLRTRHSPSNSFPESKGLIEGQTAQNDNHRASDLQLG